MHAHMSSVYIAALYMSVQMCSSTCICHHVHVHIRHAMHIMHSKLMLGSEGSIIPQCSLLCINLQKELSSQRRYNTKYSGVQCTVGYL